MQIQELADFYLADGTNLRLIYGHRSSVEPLNDYGLTEWIELFRKKYPHQDETAVLKRITFFDYAESEIDPLLFEGALVGVH